MIEFVVLLIAGFVVFLLVEMRRLRRDMDEARGSCA